MILLGNPFGQWLWIGLSANLVAQFFRVRWYNVKNFVKSISRFFPFSAGNPDLFHKNYLTIMDFLAKLEIHIISVDTFHQSELYQNFVNRWNLNVYFQIRFREIATPVEESCLDIMDKVSSTPETTNSNFHLKLSQTTLDAIYQCWKSDVFLKPLTQKFWKLSLQIIARYCKAVEGSCSEDNLRALQTSTSSGTSTTLTTSTSASRPTTTSTLSPSPSTASLTKSHARSASDTGLGKNKLCGNLRF